MREIFLQRPYLKHVRLPARPTIVDIGCYIGDFAVFAVGYLDARVIAYEPTHENFELLQENIRINGFERRIDAINMAVGPSAKVILHIQKEAHEIHSSAHLYSDAPSREVASCTLEQLLERHSLRHVDLLKVDCEGCEYDIFLHTPKAVYERIGNIVAEYHVIDGYEAELAQAIQILEAAGFSVHKRTRMLYAIREPG